MLAQQDDLGARAMRQPLREEQEKECCESGRTCRFAERWGHDAAIVNPCFTKIARAAGLARNSTNLRAVSSLCVPLTTAAG